MLLRLNKFIANSGVLSRRQADEYIKTGLVEVNGKIVTKPGTKIDPEKDIVKLDGKRVELKGFEYYAFYKPKYVISSLYDPKGRACIGDFIKKLKKGIKPVGRLDWATEGLIFLTNDGDWAQRIQHPRYGIKKIYEVKVQGFPEDKVIERWKKGMTIEGKKNKMEEVKILRRTKGNHTWLEVTLIQGYKNQIKKMCAYMGHPAEKIKRTGIGIVKLGNLKPGEIRKLNEKEIKYFLKGGINESSRKH